MKKEKKTKKNRMKEISFLMENNSAKNQYHYCNVAERENERESFISERERETSFTFWPSFVSFVLCVCV